MPPVGLVDVCAPSSLCAGKPMQFTWHERYVFVEPVTMGERNGDAPGIKAALFVLPGDFTRTAREC